MKRSIRQRQGVRGVLALICGAGVFSSVALLACQQIAGIGPTFEPSKCQEFCAAVTGKCTGTGTAQKVYDSEAECMSFCAALGTIEVKVGKETIDPVACRMNRVLESEKDADECTNASPTGGGMCGSPCETYCQLFTATCGDYCQDHPETCWVPPADSCISQCEALPAAANPGFDVKRDHDFDTMQCRMRHLVAAILNKDIAGGLAHCGHASFNPDKYCYDDMKEAPNCEKYCGVLNVACGADDAVFESTEQCVSYCYAMRDASKIGFNRDGWYMYQLPNQPAPDPLDTIGCRRTHSYFAFESPDKQCANAGPTGGTACSIDPCESLCEVQAQACAGDNATCMADCEKMTGRNDAYTVADGRAGKSEFSCRMLHTVRALREDAQENCQISKGEIACPK